MTTIKIATTIRASREQCFNLARSQATHLASAESTQERIVAGPPHDLLELGDEVTFEGRHFGFRFRLSARITEFEFPVFFVDETTKSPFKSMRHEHRFEESAEGTLMTNLITFSAPLGWFAEKLFLTPHLTRFLQDRSRYLRNLSETDEADMSNRSDTSYL